MRCLICAGAWLALTGAAQASTFGPYAGAGYGEFRYERAEEIPGQTLRVEEKEDAWKVYAGFRFLPFLAAEGAYVDLGEVDASAAAGEVQAEARSLLASLVAYVPLGRFEVFAKAGAAAWEVESRVQADGWAASRSRDGTNATYGGGVHVAVTGGLHLRAEWEKVDFDGADGEFWTAGLLYQF